MKIRNGFVSNSSTSSFIVFGFKVPYGNVDYKEYPSGIDAMVDDFNKQSGLKFGVLSDDGDFLIGYILADWCDDGGYMPEISISIEQLEQMRICFDHEVPKLWSIFKTDPKPLLLAGQRSC